MRTRTSEAGSRWRTKGKKNYVILFTCIFIVCLFCLCVQAWQLAWILRVMGTLISVGCLSTTHSSGASQDPSLLSSWCVYTLNQSKESFLVSVSTLNEHTIHMSCRHLQLKLKKPASTVTDSTICHVVLPIHTYCVTSNHK